MKVKLPTSLSAWTQSYWANTKVQLIAAIPVDGQEVVVPSHLRDTQGHGNKVSHAKPDIVTTLATKITGSVVRAGAEVHVNDGYKYVEQYRWDAETALRGSRLKLYDYTTREGWLIRVTNTLSWYRYGPGDYNYSIGYKTVAQEPTTQIGVRVRGRQHVWSFSETQRHASLPRFDPDTEKVGSYTIGFTGWYTSTPLTIEWPDWSSKSPSLFFRHAELPFLWDGGPKNPLIEDLQTLAFQDAFSQVPKAADNNIANMLEMGELVLDALKPGSWPNLVSKLAQKVSGLKSSSREVAKAVGNLWLMYRYAYSTTKSDTRQAIDYIGRKAVTYYTPLTFNGQASRYSVLSKSDVTCRVSFDLTLNAANMLGMLHHYDRMAGVNFSAYKLWDLVPFSFIVDWFFDIGGVLEDYEMKNSYADYLFSNYWWSLKYWTKEVEPFDCKVYVRWPGPYVPNKVIHDYNSSGGVTWLKRVGDSVALVGGALL